MKNFYTITLVFSYLFFSLSSSAQYTGGTYTAVTAGNWHTASGPGIWEPSEPPQNCSNCLITVAVQGEVVLNTNVTLSNSSNLIIGGTGLSTILVVPNSGATGFSSSYSITLTNDGANSTLQLINNGAFIEVSTNQNDQGDYDGIFTSYTVSGTTTSFKQVGYAPSGFSGNTIVDRGSVANSDLSGPITLSSTGTLPIILANFNAVVDNDQVNLTWTTQLEINSDHFVVQSSTNAGSTWNNIGTVAAHGNSSTPINYSFTDAKPANGTSEYRLEMVDKDGSTAYSTVVAVRIGLATSVSIYPNPASTYVNVVLGGSTTGNVTIRLMNTTGQLLLEKTVSNAGGMTVPLTVSNFPQGDYLIIVVGSDGTQQVNKLLIAK
jgi:Secretion system C-terminal sorting domain